MEMILRKAIKQDLEEIVSLYQEAIAHMIKNNIFQWDEIYPNAEVLEEDIEREEMYVLEDGNRIASCIVINEEQDELYQTGSWRYTKGRMAVIHRLCVKPKAQGHGTGKKMIQLAEELIYHLGYDIIRLDTFSQNLKARHLYEVFGYTYAGEVTFRKGLFYLMEKALQNNPQI